MKYSKIRFLVLAAGVVLFILFAGGYQLPKYASRLSVLTVLAVIDMLYWMPVRKRIKPKFVRVVTPLYFLPLILLLVFFLAGLMTPYYEWTAFFRIYFPGILMILLIGKGIFLFTMLLGDLFTFVFIGIKRIIQGKGFKEFKWMRPQLIMVFGTYTALFVMLVYFSGMFFWVNNYKLNRIEIKVNNLPKAFDGYKIIQISDFHLGSFLSAKPLKRIAQIVNDQHADIILFTGDMLNFATSEALPFEIEMKSFAAKDGIYAILGNHDYGEYAQWETEQDKEQNNQDLFAFYDRIGWHLLRNHNTIIKKDSSSIAIIGVENWSKNKRFGKKGDLKKALIGSELSHFKILMTHDPSHWDGEVNKNYKQIGLTLSGHTHAFQLAFEKGSFQWSPASMLFKQWGGLYELHHLSGLKQYLYVNRGAGTLGYPGRIGTRPEITLIVLRTTQ